MKGYHVYYNPTKEIFEHESTPTECRHSTDLSFWLDVKSTEISKRVKNLNDEIQKENMIIKECLDCHKCFMINSGEINYFRNNDLTLPKRCISCRKERKKKQVNVIKSDRNNL